MAMIKLMKASEVLEGRMIMREHEGKQIMLLKVKGKIYAMNDVCTHEAAPLHEGELGGPTRKDPYFLTCPWHEAHYDVRTGKVYQDTPWATDTETYHVQVKGEEVWVDL